MSIGIIRAENDLGRIDADITNVFKVITRPIAELFLPLTNRSTIV